MSLVAMQTGRTAADGAEEHGAIMVAERGGGPEQLRLSGLMK